MNFKGTLLKSALTMIDADEIKSALVDTIPNLTQMGLEKIAEKYPLLPHDERQHAALIAADKGRVYVILITVDNNLHPFRLLEKIDLVDFIQNVDAKAVLNKLTQ